MCSRGWLLGPARLDGDYIARGDVHPAGDVRLGEAEGLPGCADARPDAFGVDAGSAGLEHVRPGCAQAAAGTRIPHGHGGRERSRLWRKVT